MNVFLFDLNRDSLHSKLVKSVFPMTIQLNADTIGFNSAAEKICSNLITENGPYAAIKTLWSILLKRDLCFIVFIVLKEESVKKAADIFIAELRNRGLREAVLIVAVKPTNVFESPDYDIFMDSEAFGNPDSASKPMLESLRRTLVVSTSQYRKGFRGLVPTGFTVFFGAIFGAITMTVLSWPVGRFAEAIWSCAEKDSIFTSVAVVWGVAFALVVLINIFKLKRV